MALTHTNQLFSRDLKHLVDPKYSVAPARRRRPLFVLGITASIVTASVWGVYTQFNLTGKPDAPTLVAMQLPESVEPSATLQQEDTDQPTTVQAAPARIETQTVGVEKEPLDPEQVPASVTKTAGTTPTAVDPLTWRDYKIKSGDSMARIFKTHGLDTREAIRIVEHEDAGAIKKLMPGRQLKIGYDEDKKLRALSYELRSNKRLVVGYEPDGSLRFEEIQDEYDKRERTASAVIDSSLFKAGSKAGLSDKFIMKLVGIFGWDIDFAQDLREGDSFTVVYEEFVDGAVSKGTGEILAAEFLNRDRRLYAFRHVNEEGLVEYFDAEGENLRGTFLRTPMKISRITSGFSKSRLHPILKKWRAHKGVDYAAPRGTPVLATADGRVSYLGKKEGYGKTVILRHGGKYSTLYAHLSSHKSKIRPGTNIRQGQVIGFVGKTGMATAPHLHYEFRVHGVHRDPLTYESPKAEPIPSGEREEFLAKAEQWMAVISEHRTIQLAATE